MKKTVLRIVSCVIFAILLACSIHLCAKFLEQKEARKIYKPFFESETNFDVIYLGTSHTWDHVLPMEMWKEYGIASYNWGYSNCTPAEDYYILQDILKYTNPRVIVIDVYGMVEYNGNRNGKYKDSKIEQQHVQFDSFPIYSISKYNASKDVFDTYEHNEDFIWNFIMYHNRWSELTKDDFDVQITTEKGARFFTGLGDAVFTQIPEDETIQLKSVCYSYYLKIIEYCQERGIEVLSVYLPFAADEQQQRVANTVGESVTKYPNCQYVNMLTQNVLDFDTDVGWDDHHLNYSGALKVTSWLGQYLRDHYQLDDYSSNESWIEDYQAYYKHKRDILEEQTNLPSFLVQLKDSDFTAKAEIYDQNLMNSDRLMTLFNNAEIVPVYSKTDSTACARLTIYSTITKELIKDIYFTCSNTANLSLNSIVWKSGWEKANDKWYYYNTQGIMQTGFQVIDGKTYYFEKNGTMCAGWRLIDGNWYFFEVFLEPEGVMVVGWRQIGSIWYYLNENGTMATGFQEIDGKRYYFNEDGARQTGWNELDGHTYWFDENGVMAVSTTIMIDGQEYSFDDTGIRIDLP